MASEWEEVAIADAPLEIIDGDRGTNYPKQDDFASVGHCLFLNAGNVTNTGFNFSNCSFISQDKDAALRKGKAKRDDVVMTTRGTVGNVALYDASVPYEHVRINSGMVLLRTDTSKLSPRFLYQFVRSAIFQERVVALTTGSAQPQLPIRDIRRIEFPLPPLTEQHAIAHILGTLDDKIELNRRRNQTLEAMARALFKDWFVDFGPVRAKMEGREPYLPAGLWQLFPDRLDDEGKPEGWQSSTLASFASLNPESWTKKNAPDDIRYVDLSNTKQGNIEGTARMPWSEAPSRAQRILRPGDTIVGTVRPGNKSFALIGDDGMTGSTGFAVLRPLHKHSRDFVFLAATSPENIERLTHLADGAAYPAVRPDVVLASPVTVPPGEIVNDALRSFANAVSGWVDAVEKNKQESKTLAQLRDTLLPKLISGELRITDAEKFIEHAEHPASHPTRIMS